MFSVFFELLFLLFLEHANLLVMFLLESPQLLLPLLGEVVDFLLLILFNLLSFFILLFSEVDQLLLDFEDLVGRDALLHVFSFQVLTVHLESLALLLHLFD